MLAAAANFRYHHRNIGTPAFQYQLVWMPKENENKNKSEAKIKKKKKKNTENMKFPLCFFNVYFIFYLCVFISLFRFILSSSSLEESASSRGRECTRFHDFFFFFCLDKMYNYTLNYQKMKCYIDNNNNNN